MTTKTLNEVREEGLEALAHSLGPVDMVRFLQQFDAGRGDYTAERDAVIGKPTVSEIAHEAQVRRSAE